MDIQELLKSAVQQGASDLHLSAGLAPFFRVNGDLFRANLPILHHDDLVKVVNGLMNDRDRENFEQNREIDFSFEIAGLSRFRANLFMQTRGAGASFRLIPTTVPNIETLGLTSIFKEIAPYTKGLVLVTGPTGSGKTTTVAAILDQINQSTQQHILTIEDPVEFFHQQKKCLVNQREVNKNTLSFSTALRSALREDPDVLFIGELRDEETIRLAMTAAETGHLVFATLHANSAAKAINRIVDVFRGEEKALVRSLLSESLQAVIAQTLLKSTKGGRIPAFELMLCNRAIRNLIREDKIAQMYSVIQTGQTQGMRTHDQHLVQLLNANLISRQTARDAAVNKVLF
ncbi:Twitching mobility protein [Legionella massiliensis]|uniref:Twitching mobility protein n=1 Tax=Legionella massiliensis TaxID=1034943 RepID=A0A078L0V5_9GAMM|nr:type IV pilus twitching motility protein PilT [Legionella massiliensis]CDZ77669.1 Twitching mobility protein [Legionella massiliensis]CEE13407.1 Twitching mobility protein [Legionella massiliensis]